MNHDTFSVQRKHRPIRAMDEKPSMCEMSKSKEQPQKSNWPISNELITILVAPSNFTRNFQFFLIYPT